MPKYYFKLVKTSEVIVEAKSEDDAHFLVRQGIDDGGACNHPVFYEIDEGASDWEIDDWELASMKQIEATQKKGS